MADRIKMLKTVTVKGRGWKSTYRYGCYYSANHAAFLPDDSYLFEREPEPELTIADESLQWDNTLELDDE